MILNSHNRDTLVNTVSVNDRATVVGLSSRIIDGRSTVDSRVHVRFAKSKAGKCASGHRTAEAAAEPRLERGYAMPQSPMGFAETAAQPRMAALWAALAMSRLSRV
jgi:hypothetical protein